MEKDWNVKKNCQSRFSSSGAMYSKNPPNFNVDSFPWQDSFDVLFSVYRECFCSRIKYQVSFFSQLWPKNSTKYRESAPVIKCKTVSNRRGFKRYTLFFLLQLAHRTFNLKIRNLSPYLQSLIVFEGSFSYGALLRQLKTDFARFAPSESDPQVSLPRDKPSKRPCWSTTVRPRNLSGFDLC